MEPEAFTLKLEWQKGYEFLVDFQQESVPALLVDEPAPLGEARGPGASRLLAAAVANCLGASALYCLKKARVDVSSMRVTARVSLHRNDRGRLRIGGIEVSLEPAIAPGDRERSNRCLELFEDFCVVTQSVRRGIDVKVNVQPVAPTGEIATARPAA